MLAFSRRNRFTEGQLRSVTKVATWRVMVTLTNFLGGLITTGDWRVGLGVAGFALVVYSKLFGLDTDYRVHTLEDAQVRSQVEQRLAEYVEH